MDLVTLAETKTQLEIDDGSRDALLEALITAASGMIGRRYDRELGPRSTATRRFRVRSHIVDLSPRDLVAPTTVTLNPQETGPIVLTRDAGYTLEPVDSDALTGTYLTLYIAEDIWWQCAFSFRFGFTLLDIAGTWGAWAATDDVPDEIKRPVIATVGAWMDRAIASYGGGVMDNPRELQPETVRTWGIPTAAHLQLAACGLPRSTTV